MALKIRLDALKNEIATVERLLARASSDDILAQKSLQYRLDTLRAELHDASASISTKASVALIFDGSPVRGSEIIDMSFASQALHQYQELIFSVVHHQVTLSDSVGNKKNITNKTKDGSLYISGVVHGSFGFILEEDRTQYELIETRTKSAVVLADKFLEDISSPEVDSRFILEEMDEKIFRRIKIFIKTLYEASSNLKISEENRLIHINDQGVILAHERMTKNEIREEEFNTIGTLIGLSPVKRTFDLKIDDSGEIITGKISPEMAFRYINLFIGPESSNVDEKSVFLGHKYDAKIHIKHVETADGEALPKKYTLLNISRF